MQVLCKKLQIDFGSPHKIDVRDAKFGTFYEATILDVKLDDHNKDVKSIYVHYKGFADKWNEWIQVTKDETICDCHGMCRYRKYGTKNKSDSKHFDRTNEFTLVHRIAFTQTQTELHKTTYSVRVFYSPQYEKFIFFDLKRQLLPQWVV